MSIAKKIKKLAEVNKKEVQEALKEIAPRKRPNGKEFVQIARISFLYDRYCR